MKKLSSTHSLIRNIVTFIPKWVSSGDPIPKTHRKSVFLGLSLFVFGTFSLFATLSAYFEIYFIEAKSSILPLSVITILALCPGLYVMWIAFCSWRRVKGYKWESIPYLE